MEAIFQQQRFFFISKLVWYAAQLTLLPCGLWWASEKLWQCQASGGKALAPNGWAPAKWPGQTWGLWPKTKHPLHLSQAVMATTNGTDTVRLFFCLELLHGCVPGFNELCQWLMLGTAGIPLGTMSKEKGNDWLSCWPEFQILLPFVVKDEVLWDGNCLQLLVLNCNGFLHCNHAWNNLVIVYRGAWNKGLGNLAAQHMKWEAITSFWHWLQHVFQNCLMVLP